MMKSLFQTAVAAAKDWKSDDASRWSAALAYYSVFSLAPLLLIAVSIAGVVFGEEAARGAIDGQLRGALGADAAEALQSMVESARKEKSGVLMTIVGFVVLLFSASGVFVQLKAAMNRIWEIREKPNQGFLKSLKKRFLSFSMVVVVGFLLLISLVLTTAMASLSQWLGGALPVPEWIAQVVNLGVSTGVVIVLFATMFKVLPDADIEWRDVWIGATITALLFTLGKFLLGLYLAREGASSSYGAAGAVILTLLWVYYTSNIVLYGAEFTQAHAKRKGREITASDDAVRMENA